MIVESVVITLGADARAHITPIGVIWRDGSPILAPFRPSQTLDNLVRSGVAVINHTDDVRVFAGCLTGRRDWPVRSADRVEGRVLDTALSHQELVVDRVEEDAVRPRFHCRIVHEATHGMFRGFNRAQAAVIEGAILVSRLHMLPRDKIERETEYLAIAIGKTAGPRETEAWGWLTAQIAAFYRQPAGGGGA
jgi:hypothetical protein